MGLALDYGSDDSDQEEQPPALAPPPVNPAATTSALGLPPPKNKKRALKIGFDHPLLFAPTFGTAQDEAEGDEPASKKARRIKEDESSQVADKTGKGKSTLLDMLPPPKRAVVPSTITTTQTSTPAVEEETEEPTLIMPRKVAKQAVGKPEPVGLDLFGLGMFRCVHHAMHILTVS